MKPPQRKKDVSAIANFLFEAGNLKRVPRSGWWLAGVASPETVAEHSFRTAVIGFVLASLEGLDAERTTALCLFHDFAESRTTDLHAVAKRYAQVQLGDSWILRTISDSFPAPLKDVFANLAADLADRQSREAVIAKDADLLECALQAMEYRWIGIRAAQAWIPSMQARIATSVAQRLLRECDATDPAEWWRVLLGQQNE